MLEGSLVLCLVLVLIFNPVYQLIVICISVLISLRLAAWNWMKIKEHDEGPNPSLAYNHRCTQWFLERIWLIAVATYLK